MNSEESSSLQYSRLSLAFLWLIALAALVGMGWVLMTWYGRQHKVDSTQTN